MIKDGKYIQLAQKLTSVTMTTTGQLESEMTLDLSSLKVSGVISGNQGATEANPQKAYQLLEYIDGLELEETVVPPGKPPRGQTQFLLKYQDGSEFILGMNLNEAGTKYLELQPAQFQELRERWMNM